MTAMKPAVLCANLLVLVVSREDFHSVCKPLTGVRILAPYHTLLVYVAINSLCSN
jgi:hypothetical protein